MKPRTKPSKERVLVASRIREIRDSLGLTQQEVAERMGTKQQTIALIELAQKDVVVGTLIKLARAMDVHPSAFFTKLPTPRRDLDEGST